MTEPAEQIGARGSRGPRPRKSLLARARAAAAYASVGLPYVCALLLMAELALYGADRAEVGLGAAFMHNLLLVALLVTGARRRASMGAPRLQPVFLLFALVLVWTLLQLALPASGMSARAWADIHSRSSVTIDRPATLVEWVKLAGLGAIFAVGLLIGRDKDHSRALLKAFGLLAAAYALWAIVAFHSVRYGLGAPGADGRLQASLLSPNTAATLFAIWLVLAWTNLLRRVIALLVLGERRDNLVLGGWTALLVLCGTCLALTGSRGGAAAACAGLLAASVFLAVAAPPDRRWKIARVVLSATAILVIAAAAVAVGGGVLTQRLNAVDVGIADRASVLGLYWSNLGQAPWTGFGLGAFRRFNNFLAGAGGAQTAWSFGAMHNVYLQWIYESGYPGALAMFGCIGACLLLILRGLSPARPIWPTVALAVSLVLLVHGAVDFSLQIPAIAALWAFILGVGLSQSRPITSAGPRRRED